MVAPLVRAVAAEAQTSAAEPAVVDCWATLLVARPDRFDRLSVSGFLPDEKSFCDVHEDPSGFAGVAVDGCCQIHRSMPGPVSGSAR
ncbi:hypothetical protein [Frankia sp. Cj5]|uniref:hypothetical protein n=1 Tax=Frankia sp. Cj5 TaxID=2880978 RepID=UPI001EF583F5|nr:hypothetical protein [Frankia sp. Cj5]